MSEQTTPTKEQIEAKRLGFLMKLYLGAYALGIVFLLLCAFLGNNMIMFVIGIFFTAQAVVLDIYVRIKRTQLNARLTSQSGVTKQEMKELWKNRKN